MDNNENEVKQMIKVTVMYNNGDKKTYKCKQIDYYSNYTLLIIESGKFMYLPYYNVFNILEEKISEQEEG